MTVQNTPAETAGTVRETSPNVQNDGGPAFPHMERPRPDLGRGIYERFTSGGMSLRDWFAGQALPQAVADYDRMTRAGFHGAVEWVLPYATKAIGSREEIIARQAYRYADAMLAAREAKP